MLNEAFTTETRRRWLLVDDTPEVLEAVAALLELLGCAEIVQCSSAYDALATYNADPNGFELVITDLDMPEMNGVELCELIRAVEPHQPVILATGSSEITESRALEAGFVGMLRKPFALYELLHLIARAGIMVDEAIAA